MQFEIIYLKQTKSILALLMIVSDLLIVIDFYPVV